MDLLEARVALDFGSEGDDLFRLPAEQVPCRINTVDPDIHQRAAIQGFFEADISLRNLLPENRAEIARFAKLAAVDDFDGLESARLEMQAIRDHQLDAVLFAGMGHALALFDGARHGFLAQDVDASAGGTDREVGVKVVWQGDENGIDGAAAQ